MLDLAGILFSTIMMLMVIVQAVRLDREQPWFQKLTRKPDAAAAKTPTWRRRG